MDIDNAKNEGIWNNDWDLSLEFIKRFKKGNLNFKLPQREEIVKCFEEFALEEIQIKIANIGLDL